MSSKKKSAYAVDANVAAERLGGDSRGRSADGEGEAFGVGHAERVLARLERDREIAVDAAAPGGDGQLRAGVGGDADLDIAGVRRQVVAAGGVDDAPGGPG